MQQPSDACTELAAGKRDRPFPELAALAGILVGYLLLSQLLASSARRWPVLVFPGLWLLGASAFCGWRSARLRMTGGRRALPWAGASLLACAGLVALASLWPDRAASPRADLVGALGLVVLAPLAEELYFRGLLLDHLSRAFGPWAAAALVTLLFAFLHLPQGIHLPMAVLSALLCFAALATGTVLWPVVLHIAWNAAAVVRTLPAGEERWAVALPALAGLLTLTGFGLASRQRRGDR